LLKVALNTKVISQSIERRLKCKATTKYLNPRISGSKRTIWIQNENKHEETHELSQKSEDENWLLREILLLAAGRWFSPGTPVSSTNKTDIYDITEILLKVALNTKVISQILL
jgi:hypothetical protein